MKKKGFSAEQVIGKLREGEVLLSEMSTVNLSIRSHPDNARHVRDAFLASNASQCELHRRKNEHPSRTHKG